MAIAPKFMNARRFSEGLAAVQIEVSPPSEIGIVDSRGVRTSKPAQRKWGFIGQDGEIAIPPQFEAVGDFSEGLAAASFAVPWGDTDTWGYIDKHGMMAIRPQFSRADPFSEGLALVWGGGIRLTDPFVRSFVNMGFIDKSGHWVIRSKLKYFFYDGFSNGLAPFRQNRGKWGYMDKGGKTVLNPQFDWAGRFLDNGLAPVVANGKCAHIDRSGRVVGQLEEIKEPWGTRKGAWRRGTFIFNPNPPPCS
jgi:hypothetical protein